MNQNKAVVKMVHCPACKMIHWIDKDKYEAAVGFTCLCGQRVRFKK